MSAGISINYTRHHAITNFNKIKIMANKVGALIPDWLKNKFEGVENDLNLGN